MEDITLIPSAREKMSTAETTSKEMIGRKESRLHETQSEDSRILSLKMERYAKLMHQSQKQLTKQVKQVRSFLLQRKIRKMKSMGGGEEEADNGRSRRDYSDSLQPLKNLPLDLVVQQAMRQLGLIHANPDPNVEIAVAPRMDQSSLTHRLVSKILDHKRFQTSLEEWNEKVAEFRRFCLRLDEKNDPFFDGIDTPILRKKLKTRLKHATTTSLLPPVSPRQQLPTSFFCSSLNESEQESTKESTVMSAYGPASTFEYSGDDLARTKKNRAGQRARKAKALAIQAKKEGKKQEYFQSLNWREEKTPERKRKRITDGSDKKKKSRKDSESRSTLTSLSTDSAVDLFKNHPSWAAKQQQKSMIVSFQGKKITFD